MGALGGGTAQAAGRVGVIDLGSNSVRLVVFDQLRRVPQPLFNERVLCGLGRGLVETGRLDPDGVTVAQQSLRRYVALAKAMELERLDVLATEATRVAEDGPAFRQGIEADCGVAVTQLSGAREAYLSGQGVVAGIPGAHGVAADLGGGSLELAALDGGAVGEVVSLPLGTLRLAGTLSKPKAAARAVDTQLKRGEWLAGRGGTLYAVGGAWRAMARLYMAESRYPLRMIHQFRLSAAVTLALCDDVLGRDPEAMFGMTDVPRRRVRSLPAAATVLRRLIACQKPTDVVFSANGIREGFLFDQLAGAVREEDPLLAGCRWLAARENRFGDTGEALDAWIAPLFPEDDAAARRLRRAVCMIADVGWHEHPDYRSEQAFFRILRLPLRGIQHEERAAVALAIYTRYGGRSKDHALRAVEQLLDDDGRRRARAIGTALRLAETLSGGQVELLADMPLEVAAGQVKLRMAKKRAALDGEVVQRRVDELSQLLGNGDDV